MKASNYQIGAFEALEWAWRMLHGYKDQPGGVEEARRIIYDILSNMGKEDKFNFSDKVPQTEIPA